jgi:hypothetical protein
MDRHYWNHPNANYYNSNDYYSQEYQEYGQHTSQPETGQTSGGVAASGSSRSYPAPGQPRPYLDLNFPPPPSPGSNLEYLMHAPQPTPWENIIQNDVPPGPSNVQLAVNTRQRRSTSKVKEQFLAAIDKYAQGCQLKDCSATIRLSVYATDNGYLRPKGTALYNKLEQKDKDRVVQALKDRQDHQDLDSDKIRTSFLEGLEAYANGVPLRECSATINFDIYVTAKGFLQERGGKKLYDRLEQGDKDRVISALHARQELYGRMRQLHEMPASMPQTGGMDPIEMTGPMQTEAMWATAWQMTGQAVPGPSASAEPPIPYYDSEAVGADFQHQYGPYGLPRTD